MDMDLVAIIIIECLLRKVLVFMTGQVYRMIIYGDEVEMIIATIGDMIQGII